MKKSFATILLSFTLLVAIAAVTDITGKWNGTLQFDGGQEIPLVYNLKVDGNKVTGNVESSAGAFDISNGTIKGDSVKFVVNYNGEDLPNYGKIYADSISLNSSVHEQVYHMKLTRAK